MQGTIRLNGQRWSYIVDRENSRWERNNVVETLGCASGFASSTQCLTPLDPNNHSAIPPASGAVFQNDPNEAEDPRVPKIPQGSRELIYIDAPENIDKLFVPLDTCPACGPHQIDMFIGDGDPIVTYNTDSSVSRVTVFFWRMVEDRNCNRGVCPQ